MSAQNGIEHQLFNTIRKQRELMEKYNRPLFSLSDLLQKNAQIIQESNKRHRTLAEQLSHVLVQQNDKMKVLASEISSSINTPDFQRSVKSISKGLAGLNHSASQMESFQNALSRSISNSVAIAAEMQNISTNQPDIERLGSKVDNLGSIIERVALNQAITAEDIDEIKSSVIEIKDEPDYSLLYFLLGTMIALLLHFSKTKNIVSEIQDNSTTYNINLEFNFDQLSETLNLLDFEVRTSTSNLNLREYPDSLSNKIITIPAEHILIVVNDIKYWLKVNCEINGEQYSGWVSKRYTLKLD